MSDDLLLPLDGMPEPVALPPVERLSPDRARTARQRAQVDAGIHPLTQEKARPDLGTCGDCTLRVLVRHHNGTYPKCARGIKSGQPLDLAPYASKSAATDVRAWWPACPAHEFGHTGSDAARSRPPTPEDTGP